jgi:hypothetical protein
LSSAFFSGELSPVNGISQQSVLRVFAIFIKPERVVKFWHYTFI